MNENEMKDKIIESYQQDEKMMIMVFAQWCVNQELDPNELYKKAYPNQTANPMLKEAVELTVPKEESEDIANDTLLGVLSLFGNDDLAMVVTKEMKK
ncbi:hypothetical protein J2S78_001737 [Salibacterium salarium]|uniref:hypothetical protein n=1 Tax=Salibacterium salarium TaxID=284579 RepID=UPI0027854BD2|nr:hypothetical protein [Salibacterium salarium]MDQ0299317.1 hypothetical protein [Salibacterium salarium]